VVSDPDLDRLQLLHVHAVESSVASAGIFAPAPHQRSCTVNILPVELAS
jgi:hypothetical protein